MEDFYKIRVIDHSLPSIVSADKYYYDTKDSIMDFLQRGDDEKYIKAAEEYFSGRGPGLISLFGEAPEPIIAPVQLIGKSTYKKNNLNFKFFNIYRYETDMFIHHIKADIVYIVDTNKQLKRCIKASLTQVISTNELLTEEITDFFMCWGLPGFIEVDEDKQLSYNTLYFADSTFKSSQAVKKDMKHPHKPYLRNFFLEIVGDG